MSAFARPNKTKSLFAQVDAGRPAAARTKLGGIEGSQAVMQSQIAGQGQENKNVEAAQNQVASNTRDTYANLDGFGKVKDQIGKQEGFLAGPAPTFNTQLNPVGGRIDVKGAAGAQVVTGDAGLKARAEAEEKAKTEAAQKQQNKYSVQGGMLTGMNTGNLTDELGVANAADTQKLRDAELQITEGNLGQLAGESDYEIEQAQLAQVLADRQSNVGKLKNLYGVGYDTSKYGALDSNILQGQFNDASIAAKDNIAAKDLAQKEGSRVRESYLDQIDTSRAKTTEAKNIADKEITRLNGELGRLDVKIAEAIKNSGGRLTTAISTLQANKNKILKDHNDAVKLQQDAIKKANEAVAAKEMMKKQGEVQSAAVSKATDGVRDKFFAVQGKTDNAIREIFTGKDNKTAQQHADERGQTLDEYIKSFDSIKKKNAKQEEDLKKMGLGRKK
jgi:hypothetical protein